MPKSQGREGKGREGKGNQHSLCPKFSRKSELRYVECTIRILVCHMGRVLGTSVTDFTTVGHIADQD